MNRNVITSPTNQTIKDLVRLKERRGERAPQEFMVEGLREIKRAIHCGFKPLEFYVCDDLIKEEFREFIQNLGVATPMTALSHAAFQKIAVRENSDGLIAIFPIKTATLVQLEFKNKPLLLIAVEDVEKPGNLGAVLRSADATGVDAVVVLDHTIDPWNQHVIRASLGGVFSVPVILSSAQDFVLWCNERKILMVGAALSPKSKDIFKTVLTGQTAIIFGSEAKGLSPFLMEHVNELSMIPMLGVCDSLNISVSAALYMYEALRQRS